jgi:hypothetical protein
MNTIEHKENGENEENEEDVKNLLKSKEEISHAKKEPTTVPNKNIITDDDIDNYEPDGSLDKIMQYISVNKEKSFETDLKNLLMLEKFVNNNLNDDITLHTAIEHLNNFIKIFIPKWINSPNLIILDTDNKEYKNVENWVNSYVCCIFLFGMRMLLSK